VREHAGGYPKQREVSINDIGGWVSWVGGSGGDNFGTSCAAGQVSIFGFFSLQIISNVDFSLINVIFNINSNDIAIAFEFPNRI